MEDYRPQQNTPFTDPPIPQQPMQPEPSVVNQYQVQPVVQQPGQVQNQAPYSIEQSPMGATPVEPAHTAWSMPLLSHGQKDATWFGSYTLAAILLAALTYIFTRDIVSTVVVLFAVGMLIYSGSRRPVEQHYTLGDDFVAAGRRRYEFRDFKAFTVDQQAAATTIAFVPLKRFMPLVAISVPNEGAQSVIEHIADYLPMEPHKNDAIDGILKRIRL